MSTDCLKSINAYAERREWFPVLVRVVNTTLPENAMFIKVYGIRGYPTIKFARYVGVHRYCSATSLEISKWLLDSRLLKKLSCVRRQTTAVEWSTENWAPSRSQIYEKLVSWVWYNIDGRHFGQDFNDALPYTDWMFSFIRTAHQRYGHQFHRLRRPIS